MLELLILGVGVSLIGYAFYRWVTINYDYFAKRQFPYIKPTFLMGSTIQMMLQFHHVDDYLVKLYNSHPAAKIVGMFDFRQPMYLLRDPQLIKQMIVKDFDHFEDHKLFIDPTVDELFGNSLFMMRGKKWRDMRANLSPAFTGSKIRLMFDMVGDCAADMARVLSERTVEKGDIKADMKDLFGRYTTDVIATAAFGIKVNSFADEKNEFFMNGKRAMNVATAKIAAKMVLIKLFPRLMKKLNIQLFDAEAGTFFRSMALDTIRTRLEQKIYRPDMINLLMQLKTNQSSDGDQQDSADAASNDSAGFATVEESHIGKERVQHNWTDIELAAQCFLFFAAGFDTTSTLLSFLSYELAVNPDVQEKLYAECCATRDQLKGGRLTYDTLQRMQYMDQVVSESLRVWPPALITDRLCGRDYKYNDGELRFDVKEDTSLWIPIYAIHRDERYYPESSRFLPERFSDESKGSIVAGAYLPFGVGPRNCIGSRFALMEIKALVYYIVLQFSIEPTADTLIPMRLAATPGSMKPEKNIILSLKRRS